MLEKQIQSQGYLFELYRFKGYNLDMQEVPASYFYQSQLRLKAFAFQADIVFKLASAEGN